MNSHTQRCMYLQGQLFALVNDKHDQGVEVRRWMHDAHNALHTPENVSVEQLRLWEISYSETVLSALYSIEQRVDATVKGQMSLTHCKGLQRALGAC